MRFQMTRRRFLSAAGVAVTTVPSMRPNVSVQSLKGTVNHAVIGTGGRGRGHIRSFDGQNNCRVVAVCDLDPERLEEASQMPKGKDILKKYIDFRALLEDPEIDSVSIATADHWHTPIALAAILSGKHVYVEKPCSHNIHEANLLVKCADEYGKCIQHGTQRRSQAEDMAGVRAIQEGLIGEVFLAKAINHQRRGKIGNAPDESVPPGVDYDSWLGPAPKRPFTKNRWHYNWHWFWDYGGGDLANDGVHQLDEAVWGMGLDLKYPDAIVTSGGQLWYDDDHETPDTQTVIYEYGDKQIIYEMRLWTPYKLEGHDNGTVFYGTKGKIDIGRAGAVATVDGKQIDIKPEDYGIESEDIMENFVKAVLNDDPRLLNSPITKGAVTTNLCHLGNIGVRCGGIKLTYEPESETIIKASENKSLANRLVRREYRNGYELVYE